MAGGAQGGRTRASGRSGASDATSAGLADPTYSSQRAVEQLGARLRSLRLARSMTIAQLAEAAGLTKGFVSRLERDQSSVSIAALIRICDVLHTPIGSLFEAPATCLVRAGDATIVEFGKDRRQSIHTPANIKDLQVIRVQLAPGASAGREAFKLHGGVQFIQVLAGSLDFWLESERFRLAVGDSLTFRGNLLHTYRNVSRTKPSEVLMAFAPVPA